MPGSDRRHYVPAVFSGVNPAKRTAVKLERLDENIGAAAVELTPDDLREIESAVSKMTIQGDRYPANLQKMTGR